MCEAQLHEKASFLTLTYNDETLLSRRPEREPTVPCTPPFEEGETDYRCEPRPSKPYASLNTDSLRPRDVQLFIKKLRYELTTRNPHAKVRYYAVGEYGERFKRPHYHIALFGEDFSDDRKYWRTSGAHPCYRSSRLERLWTDSKGRSLGNSEIGELTIDSAAYIAAYVLKKVNGKMADEHYRRDLPNGEVIWITPEFALMSRGGRRGRGIAAEWLAKYSADVYPHDHVIHDGRKLRPPRYFDKLLEQWDPVALAQIKLQREHRAKELAEDNTPARLADKETVCKAKLALKKHTLE